jgi:hypothetical protein
MRLGILKRLIHGTLVIAFWSVSLQVGWPQSTSVAPYLSFEFNDRNSQKGTSANDIVLKRAERLEFQIQYVTNAPYRASKGINYSPLSIRATNQHPDFFKERPGPTVSLEAWRVGANERQPVPIRIFSSGEGYSNGVHYLSVSIDILEPEEVRHNKIDQFVSQLRELASRSGSAAPGAMLGSARTQGRSAYFDEFYISNPPGVYDLRAVFRPDLAVSSPSVLTASALVEVLDGPDSLEPLKQKLTHIKKEK